MTHPRGLSEAEAAAWESLAETVEPMHPGKPDARGQADAAPKPVSIGPAPREHIPPPRPSPPASPRRNPPGNLDSHWDRKLKAGDIAPDLSLDLHGHGLDAAYTRLMGGMEQARGIGARVVLIVTGKSRPVDAADRGTSRGAIRAKILDWLAASEHADAIAAIRKAHRRHGGEGALYIVLRRAR